MSQDWVLLAPGGIVCFTPLAMYLFWLASVNRQDRPTVVSGTWDFVALLSGLSGVILCVGILLTALSANLPVTSKKGFGSIRDAWANGQLMIAITPIAYVTVLAGCAYLVLRSRRRTLHIYSIHQPSAENAIDAIFEKLNWPTKRLGNLWSDGRGAVLELSAFPIFSHLVFAFHPNEPRRVEELERELRQSLAHQRVGENPGGPWLTTASVSAFICTVSCVILTFAMAWRR